jgi:hypothetical protein
MILPDYNPNPVIDARTRWSWCTRFTLCAEPSKALLIR